MKISEHDLKALSTLLEKDGDASSASDGDTLLEPLLRGVKGQPEVIRSFQANAKAHHEDTLRQQAEPLQQILQGFSAFASDEAASARMVATIDELLAACAKSPANAAISKALVELRSIRWSIAERVTEASRLAEERKTLLIDFRRARDDFVEEMRNEIDAQRAAHAEDVATLSQQLSSRERSSTKDTVRPLARRSLTSQLAALLGSLR